MYFWRLIVESIIIKFKVFQHGRGIKKILVIPFCGQLTNKIYQSIWNSGKGSVREKVKL